MKIGVHMMDANSGFTASIVSMTTASQEIGLKILGYDTKKVSYVLRLILAP